MNKSVIGSVCALLGYSIFGFSFLFSKSALNLTTPFVLLSVRFITAFVILNIIVLLRKTDFSLRGKPIKKLLLLGFVQPVIYFICENYGISMTSSSFSGIMLGIVPVVGLVLGRVFLKEKCSLFQGICAIISIIGVALTTAGGAGNFSLTGTLLLICAAVSSSFFSVISRQTSKQFSPLERTYVMFALGSIVFTSIALIENRGDYSALLTPLSSPGFWISVLYLSAASSVGAFLLLNYAMNYISVSVASIFSNFTTVISVLAGIFIMHDSFTCAQIAGIIIITLSVLGVSYRKRGTV